MEGEQQDLGAEPPQSRNLRQHLLHPKQQDQSPGDTNVFLANLLNAGLLSLLLRHPLLHLRLHHSDLQVLGLQVRRTDHHFPYHHSDMGPSGAGQAKFCLQG